MSGRSGQLAAQQRRVQRHFRYFTTTHRAMFPASHRPGGRVPEFGRYFYTHPDLPGRAFESRGRAALAALAVNEAAHEAVQPFVSSWAGQLSGLDTHDNLDVLATSKIGSAEMTTTTSQPTTSEDRDICMGCMQFADEGHSPGCPYGPGFEGLSGRLAAALAHQRVCLPDLDAGCMHTRPYFPGWTLRRAVRDLTRDARDEAGTVTVTLAAAGELVLCEPARDGQIRFVSMRMAVVAAGDADAFTSQP